MITRENMYALIAAYFCVVSLISAVLTVRDKRASKRPGTPRVPEKTLLVLAAAGGGLSMLITMIAVRHKTRKLKFMAGIPAIIISEYGLFLFIYNIVNGM